MFSFKNPRGHSSPATRLHSSIQGLNSNPRVPARQSFFFSLLQLCCLQSFCPETHTNPTPAPLPPQLLTLKPPPPFFNPLYSPSQQSIFTSLFTPKFFNSSIPNTFSHCCFKGLLSSKYRGMFQNLILFEFLSFVAISSKLPISLIGSHENALSALSCYVLLLPW